MSFFASDRFTSTPSPRKKKTSSNSNSKLSELNDVLFTMKLQSLPTLKTKNQISRFPPNPDKTLLLPDHILLNVLSKLPSSASSSQQQNSNSLVCTRWLNLQGRLVRSLKVLDWDFIESGRIFTRFPNLTHIDLVSACVNHPINSGITASVRGRSMRIGNGFPSKWDIVEEGLLPTEVVDRGLRVIASGYPNLRKLAVMNATELGLLSVAEECLTLQELELHKCNDNVLKGIAACGNLQVLKLVGSLDGFYGSAVSDMGLMILAQGCKRLVKLELSGCGGSFDGIKAIGQCCQMLEELTVSDHQMESGWLAALLYCENLKTLKIHSCKSVDPCPDPVEYLGCCQALERLHLQQCQLRERKSVGAIFAVCREAREIIIEDCWGLDNDVFSLASCCRRVRFLSLEGCSLLTTQGLESVILIWKELESLRVVSCKNIKDSEVSPALASVFSALKNWKWRPGTRSLVSSGLKGSSVGKRGFKLLKKLFSLKKLPEDYGLHFDFLHR